MRLEDIKSIPKKHLKQLKKDNWTVELLARSDVYVLETYLRVNKETARKIIDEAQSLLMPAADVSTTHTYTEQTKQTGQHYNPDEPPKEMSVKVKRIYDSLNR